MTRVTDLSVRNFKAVEEAEVQPGGVNLVVGRNNVGKTSLLEALHLALNPSSLSRFDENLDKVVREGAEKANVRLRYEGDRAQQRDLIFNRSGNRRYDATKKSLKSEIDRVRSEYADKLSYQRASKVVFEAIKNYRDNNEDTKIDKNEAYVIVDGDEYSYVSNSLENSPLNQMVADSYSTIRGMSDISSETGPLDVQFPGHYSEVNDSEFVGETPDSVTSTHSIHSPVVSGMPPDSAGEGDAIRRSRIEDFLIDNEIVDGLVDFSFGRLVFEDGDEREEVPYDFMGSGFKTLVGILWELYDQDADTEVLIIEEPAVHMHPGYVNEFTQQLLQVARQEDVQLFVTTHREDLIESFFAPPTERAHGDYLREEFQVIQLTELLTKQLDYEQAETELDELNTDLRGI